MQRDMESNAVIMEADQRWNALDDFQSWRNKIQEMELKLALYETLADDLPELETYADQVRTEVCELRLKNKAFENLVSISEDPKHREYMLRDLKAALASLRLDDAKAAVLVAKARGNKEETALASIKVRELEERRELIESIVKAKS
jgi:hypothetical protein